jgi:hypothetical protein
MEILNKNKVFLFQDKTVIIKELYQCKKGENLHWLDLKYEDDQSQSKSKGFRIDALKQSYLIDLTITLPIEYIYTSFKNQYIEHEKVSDIVTKTWTIQFETPFKFFYGNSLDLFGTVYTDNIYFDFKPNELKWKKWKKQTVEYDTYFHYFIYLEHEFLFSNGGYGSHMDIKATFVTDSETNQEYALIHEIQFYDVKDPDNTIKIGQIRSDIFKYEIDKIKNKN